MTAKHDLWLDRTIMAAPHLALCLTREQFESAVADLAQVCDVPMFPTQAAHAATRIFERPQGGKACIVTLRDWEGRDPIEVAGLLVHEAVHVFQQLCEDIGEHQPSAEFEAYSVQTISQQLMWAFVELTAPKT